MPLTSLLVLLAIGSAKAAPVQAAVAPAAVERPLVAEKKWALCVGAGAYTDLAPLKYSPNDARAFAKALEEAYGFEPSTIGLISDAGTDPNGKRPVSATILGELDRLLGDKCLDRGDLFVFYFSGHGIGKPSGDYLMPTDVPERDAERSAIPVKTLIERFVKAGLKNVLVVADACRSGAQNPFGKELQELGKRANIAVLLGCAPGQRSYEYPRLEKGVFTHFLIKAMADRKLADAGSGALWASSVARAAAANVKSYTEADYGDDAQVPAVWSEPSQDVLMAAYPPASGDAKGWLDGMIASEGGALPRTTYGRFLSTMGRTLSDGERRPEAIQAFKTLDGLGLASWRDLAALAAALNKEGREGELGSLIARAVREPVPTDLSELVVLHGDVENVGADRYLQALRVATRPETYGFQGAQILATLLRIRMRASPAQIAVELKPYVPLFGKDSMQGRFVAATIALGEGRPDEALALAEAATPMPEAKTGNSITSLRQIRFLAAQELKDEAKMDAIALEGEADPEDAFPWASVRLERMRMRSDPGFVAAVREAGARTISDSRLTELMVMLGADAGTLLPDAERLLLAHPYSWQAPMNVWLAKIAAAGFKTAPELPQNAFKYAPSKADLIRVAFNRLDDTLEKARIAKRIDNDAAARERAHLAGWYREYWTDIRDEPVALAGMGRMILRAGQTLHGAFFAREFLWPYAKTQTYAKRELMGVSLFLALNGADEATAREIFAAMDAEGILSPRAIVRYAMHQALAGDEKEAERAIARWSSLKAGEPDEAIRGYFLMTRAYLAARRGDPVAAKAFIARTGVLDEEALNLGWLARFEAEGRVGVSEDLVNYLYDPNAEFSDIHIASLASLVAAYTTKTTAIEREVLLGHSLLLAEHPGHPWVQRIGFNGLEGIAHWTGRTEWSGTLADGISGEPCTFRLDVDAAGKAAGILDLPELPGRWTLSGTVDARGNLVGTVSDEKGKELLMLAMKLPPMAIAETFADSPRFRALLMNAPWGGAELRLFPTKARPLAPGASSTGTPGKTPGKKSNPMKTPPKKTAVKKTVPKSPPARKVPPFRTLLSTTGLGVDGNKARRASR